MPDIHGGHRAPMPSSVDAPPPEIGLTGARFGGASRKRRTRAERAADAAATEAAAAPEPAARERVAPEPVAPEPAAPAAEPFDVAPIGLTGARFGGASRARRERPRAEARRAEASRPAAPEPAPVAPAPPRPVVEPWVDPGPPEDPSPFTFVRPYVLTGGRTRAGVEFAIEALITSVLRPGSVGEPMEHARIRELCREPRSVAEVAALLGMPLGVARVLLADMLAAGAVEVHRTVDAGGPDLALMQRVLAGLRRL